MYGCVGVCTIVYLLLSLFVTTQDSQYIIPVDGRFNGKVTFNYTADIGDLLRKNMSETGLNLFRETIFGHILDVGHVWGQGQLVHGLCLREIECVEPQTIQYRIGGSVLRFGLREFGIVSGLRIHGDLRIPDFEDNDDSLMTTYFNGGNYVRKSSLEDVIKFRRCKDPADEVKLAVVYVIHFFIISSRSETNITKNWFAFVESGQYTEFPWGLLSFNALYTSLKGRLANRQREESGSQGFHYKVDGCPVVFQCWFYECCDRICGTYASRKGSGFPRMCNWNAAGSRNVHLEAINKTIFDAPGVCICIFFVGYFYLEYVTVSCTTMNVCEL